MAPQTRSWNRAQNLVLAWLGIKGKKRSGHEANHSSVCSAEIDCVELYRQSLYTLVAWTETALLSFVFILRPSGERLCYDAVSSVEIRSVLCVCRYVCGATAPQWAMASSFTRFLDHTQRRNTVGRTPLDEWSACRRDLNVTSQTLTTDEHPCLRWDSKPQSEQAIDRTPTP